MWTRGAIETILPKKEAHAILMRKKMTKVGKKKEWINGYEFGLFTGEKNARIMAETLHIHGMIMSDVVSPVIHQLALLRGYEKSVRAMERFRWNMPAIRGIFNRPDGYILMLEGHGLNAYEYTLLHDTFMSGKVGHMIKYHQIPLYKVVRYCVFKKSPPANIKALMSV